MDGGIAYLGTRTWSCFLLVSEGQRRRGQEYESLFMRWRVVREDINCVDLLFNRGSVSHLTSSFSPLFHALDRYLWQLAYIGLK